MRLTSEFWVSALVRRINGGGAFAALANKGAAEAGAIFIKFRNADGSYDLFGPAPQMVYDETKPDERQFTLLQSAVAEAEADAALDKPFADGAKQAGLVALEGHRSVGGFRASIYNAMPKSSVQALADLMADFAKRKA